MICVSYVRSISNCFAIESPPNAISIQNKTIHGFLKERGWKLSAKYADRKLEREDETAFLQMKQDGMDRKFECVVFSSLFYCGKTLTSATDLLGHIFYPAGIHFAVAEDGFCSADVTAEEVDAYIKKIRHEYRARNSSHNTSKYNPKTVYKKYGYVRVSEEELEIDPEPAEIIREIFQLSHDGKSMSEIADILNERGVESCMAYRRRKTGIDYKYGTLGWTGTTVSNILKSRVYYGEWIRTIRGEKITYSCPPIIDKEMFRKTREAILDRDNAKGKRQKYKGRTLFSRKIVDEETDWPLHVYTLPKDGSKVYRFAYPAPVFRAYKTMYLACEPVEQEVRRLLYLEGEKVKRAVEMLAGSDGQRVKQLRIEPIQKKAKKLFLQMAELEDSMVPLEDALNNGALDEAEYERRSFLILAEIAEADAHIQTLIDQIDEIETAFSLKNPWVKRYMNMEEIEELNYSNVKKYVGKVKLRRFEEISFVPYHEEWFQKLPSEWFAEMGGN